MNKVQIMFINEALDQEHELTEWEVDFIHNLAERDNGAPLSEKQNKILNRIQGKLS